MSLKVKDLLKPPIPSTPNRRRSSALRWREFVDVAMPKRVAPGNALVYPSTMLHEVVPVRSGQRPVSITFIESLVADQHRRMQVQELNEIAALEGKSMQWESRVRLDVARQDLMRMWSTT